MDGLLTKCTIEDHEWVILEGSAKTPNEELARPTPTVQRFNLMSMEGKW